MVSKRYHIYAIGLNHIFKKWEQCILLILHLDLYKYSIISKQKGPDMLELSQHTSNTLANVFYFCSSNCWFILLFWKMTFLLLWGNGDELATCVWEIVNENNFFHFSVIGIGKLYIVFSN